MINGEHTLVGGQKLKNVHHGSVCIGQVCSIHNPSDHHMSEFPQNFRSDTGVLERICPHGIGHPDPDHMVWANDNGLDWHGTHGCDLCCRPPQSKTLLERSLNALHIS